MVESAIIVAVIVALVQVVKTAGVPSRFAPILSLALGVAASYFVGEQGIPAALMVFNGIVYGLSASGLYSGVKATVL